jgi:HAD superfamily hydrolase (TIGR01509 family)
MALTGVVLFDLDGTLVDADHLHYEAWRAMVAPLGVDLTLDYYRSEIMGFSNDLILANMVPGLSQEAGIALCEDKEKLFRSMATKLEPAPGLVAFVARLETLGVPMGVVTNAPRANAEQELRGIGFEGRFATVVIGDELKFAKPHPLPYLTGLERLGGSAARSLAFEDSLSGLRSALAAGLTAIGVTTGLSAERLRTEGAALAVQDFTDPALLPFVESHLVGWRVSAEQQP